MTSASDKLTRPPVNNYNVTLVTFYNGPLWPITMAPCDELTPRACDGRQRRHVTYENAELVVGLDQLV